VYCVSARSDCASCLVLGAGDRWACLYLAILLGQTSEEPVRPPIRRNLIERGTARTLQEAAQQPALT
jgi:hypothetical protein